MTEHKPAQLLAVAVELIRAGGTSAPLTGVVKRMSKCMCVRAREEGGPGEGRGGTLAEPAVVYY